MKIHTKLTYGEMQSLPRLSGAPISFHQIEQVGSRTHANGFHVRLEGTGGRNNTGLYGAGDFDGATWDEWGAFFGALFDLDPEARAGGSVANPVYRDAGHYHYLTGERFVKNDAGHYLPADAHPRHNWEYLGTWGDRDPSGYACKKDDCSAERPPYIAGKDWS